MGYYINPPEYYNTSFEERYLSMPSKGSYFVYEYHRLKLESYLLGPYSSPWPAISKARELRDEFSCYLFCVVDNGWMNAAALAFDANETAVFASPSDTRPKWWFLLPACCVDDNKWMDKGWDRIPTLTTADKIFVSPDMLR